MPNNSLKLLIAEDDESSALFLSTIAGNIFKEILFAINGKQAVETCIKDHSINMILMDIKMPEMDGIEATRLIRTFNNQVVIIAQTAFNFPEFKENAFKAGCNDYLSKPVKKSELVSIIKKYL